MSGTLISSGVKTMRCRLADLVALPDPISQGTRHLPVRHDELVATMKVKLERAGYQVVREEYALGYHGARLFGVLDLIPDGPLTALVTSEQGLTLGFRSGNDRSMSIHLVAGARVTVCDNMVLSGDMIVLRRKHTTHLNLAEEVAAGVDELTAHYRVLEAGINRLKAACITDQEAKEKIYDAFLTDHVLATKYLPAVNRNYFEPEEEWTDCRPRTLWGVHNAFTRTVKLLESPATQLAVTNRLGQVFNLRKDVVEVG